MGSDPNILFNDIHGKGTGWCTAGGIETASNHLNGGDFYVYYTMDKDGEFTCPRIAIRMEDYNIAEVRGIGPNQNLEPNMEIVAKEKLKEFPDGEKYQKKVNDMELLTLIHKKNQEGQNLTREELMFLYEINYMIEGFGYSEDPRIDEIKSSRDMHCDCKCIFDGTITEFDGYLNLRGLTSAEGIVFPKEIKGVLSLNSLTSADGLHVPETIVGKLILPASLELTEENIIRENKIIL